MESDTGSATTNSALTPEGSEYEGYQGNYGNTLERWYRRAAVVIWPRSKDFAVRAEAAPSWALDELVQRAQGPDGIGVTADDLKPFWRQTISALRDDRSVLAKTLAAAHAAGDPDLATILLEPFTIEHVAARHLSALTDLTATFGIAWTTSLLEGWFTVKMHHYLGFSRADWIRQLPELCARPTITGRSRAAQERRAAQEGLQRSLVTLAWPSLALLLSRTASAQPTSTERQELEKLGTALSACLRAAITVEASDVLTAVAKFSRQHRPPC
ncbi:hypothetical protein [Kineosporia sp. NBRC 101731]|uniref:hypothetical protein n=1 Tax=Kineosporia sp. NBRC 101731 TaxID=3032199 RepID=UPI0024A48BF1|nr:hypothetical protein [Kineosporia sp. NBRC 101731]GLY32543.1 hypothetical protein Kisp02_59080 [Kineosporia sp. NBRC 101731]